MKGSIKSDWVITKDETFDDFLHEVAYMSEPPESFDWRNKSGVSYVSPVKDQGLRGTCYAFAAVS